MSTNKVPFEIVASETHQFGRMTVVSDTLRIHGKEYPYTYTQMKDSVCIVAQWQNQIVLIDQYRHGIGKWMLEMPAGGVDDNESDEEAARRELLEETGYIAGELFDLGSYYVSEGTSTGKCGVYFTKCIGCVKVEAEDTELIKIRLIDCDELENMIRQNGFHFLIGLVGWYRAKENKLL